MQAHPHPDTILPLREGQIAYLQVGDTIALAVPRGIEWALVLSITERPLTQVDVTILRSDLTEESYTTSKYTVARIA